MAIVAGVLSVVLIASVVGFFARSDEKATSPRPEPLGSGSNVAVLASKLADQAHTLPGDPQGSARLLLAAHAVDPDNRAYLAALAEVVIGQRPAEVDATIVTQVNLGGDEPITYAAASADTSFMIVSGQRNSAVWQTRWIGDPPQVNVAQNLIGPTVVAAGAGGLTRSTLVLGDRESTAVWMAASPQFARLVGNLGHTDTIAVKADGQIIVSVDATTATVWEAGSPLGPKAKASLSYPASTTALAFSPSGQTLIGGHASGSVTVHAFGYPNHPTTKRELAGTGGPVNAVAVSADAAMALAVHDDGSLSVWNLADATATEPAVTVNGALRPGAHRAWLGARGDFAILADTSGSASLWSLADRQHPRKLIDIGNVKAGSVPAMLSADGRRALTIDRANMLSIWNLDALARAIDDPVALACQLADPSDEQWRQMVPDPALTNPCRQPGPPPIDQTPR